MNKTQEKSIRKELNSLIRLFNKVNNPHKVDTIFESFKLKGSVDIEQSSWFNDEEFEIYETNVEAVSCQKSKFKNFITFDIHSLDTTEFIDVCGLREPLVNLRASIIAQFQRTCEVINGIVTIDTSNYDLEEELVQTICDGSEVDYCVDWLREMSLNEETVLKKTRISKDIPISTDYSAIVTEESNIIKVGCQSIHISDVRALVKLWESLNPSFD